MKQKKINEVSEDDIDLSSFEVRKELCPAVWDENLHLKPEIRIRLLEIAETFYADLELEPELHDVIFTGSLANYNWSSFSDVDLHLLLDFMEVDVNTVLVKHYVDSQKKNWNGTHSIFIHEFPVEIYVQDISEPHIASGIYSLYKDEWIIKPNPLNPTLDRNLIKRKAATAEDIIDELYEEYKSSNTEKELVVIASKINKLGDRIKNMRKAGLQKNGEFSYENIVFKVLRRFNYMEKLMKLRTMVYDKINSID